MIKKYSKDLCKVIQIDEDQIKEHLGELVRGSAEETLNKLLDAEADQLCNAARYERSDWHTNPGPVTLTCRGMKDVGRSPRLSRLLQKSTNLHF